MSLPHYTFKGTLDGTLCSLRNTTDLSQPTSLSLVYSDASTNWTCAVTYVGKLSWSTYAEDEMITLVLPQGLGVGAPVCLVFKWAHDSKGNKNVLSARNAFLRDYKVEPDGTTKVIFRVVEGDWHLGYHIWSVSS